jgi:hypothetical protein
LFPQGVWESENMVSEEANKPKFAVVPDDDTKPMTIAKPGEFSLDKFKSKRAPAAANVETLLTALPHYNIKEAKDFVRLHPDEEKY